MLVVEARGGYIVEIATNSRCVLNHLLRRWVTLDGFKVGMSRGFVVLPRVVDTD